MPRWPRNWRPGSCQHLISRFVDRTFRLADDDDRRVYLAEMGAAARLWDWRIVSFALMSSHIHRGTLAGTIAPGHYFGSLHSRYAAHWRRKHGGLGPVFADRPSNYEISPQAIGRLVAYHHRNPVRAKVVVAPRDSRWTSHRMYLRLDPAPTWLDVEHGLALLGFSDTESGRKHFDQFVCDVDLDDFYATSSLEVGECAQDRRVERIGTGRPMPISNAQWMTLWHLACEVTGVPAAMRHFRCRDLMPPRRLAAFFAHRHLGQTLTAVATQFGVSTAAVHHWLHRSPQLVDSLQSAIERMTERWEAQHDSSPMAHPVGKKLSQS